MFLRADSSVDTWRILGYGFEYKKVMRKESTLQNKLRYMILIAFVSHVQAFILAFVPAVQRRFFLDRTIKKLKKRF